MIVNAAGKPYSKRDGGAFVGDFRDKGFCLKLFANFWRPGMESRDERENVRDN